MVRFLYLFIILIRLIYLLYSYSPSFFVYIDMFLDVMTNQEGKHCYPAPIQNVTMNDISIRMAWLSSAEQLEFLSGYKECLEGADDRLMKTRQTITSIIDTVRSALDRTESRLVWKATVAPLAHTICQTDMETSTLRAKLCKIFDAAKSKPLNKFFNDLRLDLVKLADRYPLEPST